ncbi:hypothetical protein [Allohahella marinimesophila]|uniref:Uncharacterized protein n=1 Tax=Allohahella marinimesophila TaxID=1054972 RepID=A0ABP7NJC1_9GAMM
MLDFKHVFKLAGKQLVGTTMFLATLSLEPAAASAPWPDFAAINLNKEPVQSSSLIGQRTIVIVTPSEEAADSTQRWVEALRSEVEEDAFRVRTLITLDLPFFVSVEAAVGDAKEVVPEEFHDQTWILDSDVLEDAIGVERGSSRAAVIILDSQGNMVELSHGPLTEERLQTVVKAARALNQ